MTILLHPLERSVTHPSTCGRNLWPSGFSGGMAAISMESRGSSRLHGRWILRERFRPWLIFGTTPLAPGLGHARHEDLTHNQFEVEA